MRSDENPQKKKRIMVRYNSMYFKVIVLDHGQVSIFSVSGLSQVYIPFLKLSLFLPQGSIANQKRGTREEHPNRSRTESGTHKI